MNKTVAWIIGIIVVLVIIIFIAKFNKLSVYDEALSNAWTPLGNVLGPRYAEVPKLINEVILYTGKEDAETKDLMQKYREYSVTKGAAEQLETAGLLEEALASFFIQAGQRYPGISSHYQYMNLMQGFQQSASQMGPMVSAFNHEVDKYNSYAREFPNNLVAAFTGFGHEASYFRLGK